MGNTTSLNDDNGTVHRQGSNSKKQSTPETSSKDNKIFTTSNGGSNNNITSSTPKFISSIQSIESRALESKTLFREKQLLEEKFIEIKKNNPYANYDEEELKKLINTDILQQRVQQDLFALKSALSNVDLFINYFFRDIKHVLETYELELMYDNIEKEKRQELIIKKREEWEKMQDLPVKLLLSDIGNAQNFLTPVLKIAAQATGNKYALNHAGLQFGPYILDWNNSGIAMPRFFTSKKAVCLLPIATIPKNEDTFRKLAEICVEWNMNWTYADKLNNDSQHKGNCQYFVSNVLLALDLKQPWKSDGVVAKNIEKIINNEVTSEMLKLWDENGVCYNINTHDDLWKFYDSIQNRKNNSPEVYNELEMLCKSMERVCQLRSRAGRFEYSVDRPIFSKASKALQNGEIPTVGDEKKSHVTGLLW